jgi:YidC/Oxa1 family membrane protein insertase
MDTKRLMIAMMLSFVLIFGWQQLVVYLDKAHPEWHLMSHPEAATQPSATTMAVANATTNPAPSTGPSLVIAQAAEAKTVEIGSATPGDKTYAMQVKLTSRGAGIDVVTLNDEKRTVASNDRYQFQQPFENDPDQTRAMSTQWISVDGNRADVLSVDWRLEKSDASSATYALDLGGKITARKTYALEPRATPGAGYEVKVEYSLTNTSSSPVSVTSEFNGPVAPPRELDRGPDRQVIGGYLNLDQVAVVNHYVDEFTPTASQKDLTKDGEYPLLWLGTGSVYFNAFLRPDTTDAKKWSPSYIAKGSVKAINPEAEPPLRFVNTIFDTTELTVAPGAIVVMPMRLFMGPKQRGVVDNTYYSALPFGYQHTLVMRTGPCSYCVFDWIINLLVELLRGLHVVLRDWGLAIIALVAIVRLVLHPITKKSQVNMMRMGKMGPEMEKLKKKYVDDKEGLNKAMMGVYKEQGMTPVWGCLPMFLQMPIFIGLWSALQTTFELRQAPFLYVFGHHLTWIYDLSQPDKAFWFPNHPVNFYFIHFDAINVLPILVAIVSFVNQKVTPKPPPATPEAAQQQKMMQWMTLVFPLIFYNMPSGLNLYYVTSMGVGIGEGYVIRKHIKEREEAEKAGKVFVKTKLRRRDDDDNGSGVRGQSDKPKGWFGGVIASIQQRAEAARREMEKRNRKK